MRTKIEEVQKHVGKQVFLKLKDGSKFNGIIINLVDDSLDFKDKFDQNVTIDLVDISFIMEKRGNNESHQ